MRFVSCGDGSKHLRMSHPRQNRIIESLTGPLFQSLLCYAFYFAGSHIEGINITALSEVQWSVWIMNGRDEHNQLMNTHTLTRVRRCMSTNRPKTFSMSDFSNGSVSITIAHVDVMFWCVFLVGMRFVVVVEIVVPLIDHCEIAIGRSAKLFIYGEFIRKFRNLFHISHVFVCKAIGQIGILLSFCLMCVRWAVSAHNKMGKLIYLGHSIVRESIARLNVIFFNWIVYKMRSSPSFAALFSGGHQQNYRFQYTHVHNAVNRIIH